MQIGTALTDPDSSGGIYNQTPNSAIKSYVDSQTPYQSFTLGENLTALDVVSLYNQ